MAMPWFRMYTEFADDPKVQIMPEPMQRRLVMIFCLRGKEEIGTVGETLHETEIAFHLRISTEELAQTKAAFLDKGFIDEQWNVINWDHRNYLSDSSTDRVRRFRQGQKQDGTLHETDETEVKRNCNAIDTDTDTDTEQKKQVRTPKAPPVAFEVPEWVPREAWDAWIEVRRKKRAANTERALRMAVRELEKLHACGESPEAVLDQSTLRSWTGLFPVKGNGHVAPAPVAPKQKSQYELSVEAQRAERQEAMKKAGIK